MTLHEQITKDIKDAMKSGDTKKRDTLRSIDSMIKNEEIAQGKRNDGLDDVGVVTIIKRAIKQRRDSAKQYKDGGREELASKEESEILIIEQYLPKQMNEDDVCVIVEKIIETVGATGKSDIGKVMGLVMREVGDQADGNMVRTIVEEIL